jgi:hypothetical protein
MFERSLARIGEVSGSGECRGMPFDGLFVVNPFIY